MNTKAMQMFEKISILFIMLTIIYAGFLQIKEITFLE